jgi:hypothetical protein
MESCVEQFYIFLSTENFHFMFLFWFRFSKNWWVSSSRKCWRYNLNALKICCSSVQHMAKLCLNLLLVWFLSFSPCFGKNVEILVTGNFHISSYWFSIQIEYKLMAYIFMRWFWWYLFIYCWSLSTFSRGMAGRCYSRMCLGIGTKSKFAVTYFICGVLCM